MVDFIGETKGSVCLPGVMMLGYVAAHSENLASAVIVSKVHVHVYYKYGIYKTFELANTI